MPGAALSDHPLATSGLPKHLVVTAYIIADHRVLLLFHKKLQKWLPPGGHVETDEDPWRAVIREAKEETGLDVTVVEAPDRASEEPGVFSIPRPHHVQVETIDGQHEHIDLAYVCHPTGGALLGNDESQEVRWFSEEDLANHRVGANVATQVRRLLRAPQDPGPSP